MPASAKAQNPAIRALTSELASRIEMARAGGLTTYSGKRNVSAALGYLDTISLKDYRARYERDPVAATVVEAMPMATWRDAGVLIEDEDPNALTDFEKAWIALEDRLRVWPRLMRADILAGLGRYAIVLIGGAPTSLELELAPMRSVDAVAGFQVFAEMSADIKSTDLVPDAADRRFGQPKFYSVKLSTPTGIATKKVHFSRIQHVSDGLLDSDLFGTPRLQRVWNRLDDLEKVAGGGSEAYWQRVQQGLLVKINHEVALALAKLPDGGKEIKAAMASEIEDYIHGFQRVMRLAGAEVEPLGSDVSNFDRQVDALLTLISAGSKIPKRILSGSELGELASTQDQENWNTRVSDRRRHYADPMVVRPLVDKLIALGALPKPTEYQVRWPDVDDLTDKEKADVAKVMSDTQNGDHPVYATDEIRDRVWGWPPLVDVQTDDEAAEETVEPVGVAASTRLLLAMKRKLSPLKGRSRVALTVATRKNDERTWSAIHEAATTHQGRVRTLMVSGLQATRRALDEDELVRACVLGPGPATVVLLEAVDALDAEVGARLPDRLKEAVVAGARAAIKPTVRALSAGSDRYAAPVSFGFDADASDAAEWADARAAQLIDDVGEEIRAAIRTVVGRAFREGRAPKDIARQLRTLIGLTERQAEAVVNLRSALAEARPGTLVKAGSTRIRVPKTGATSALIDKRAKEYADRLLRQRAMAIARSEVITASNEGARQLWRQAVEKGLMSPDSRRVWVAGGPNACPTCVALDGQTAAIDGTFAGPDGPIDGPTAHTNCTCSVGIEPGRLRRAAEGVPAPVSTTASVIKRVVRDRAGRVERIVIEEPA